MSGKAPGNIRRLEECVINRIAAGEVIQRPANALKELIENCLDAGARNVNITVKSGGLKLLQIQDDGCGIRREDLPIVCERFTTSKLQTFEDLLNIQTYGFRGEALASMSHVAHLSILTKTEGSICAYKAEYKGGKLIERNSGSNPEPSPGNQGTTIYVEDLFYNMDSRRRALKNPSEEHNKILEVVTRYSIHNSKVGFSLKKHGDSNNDLRTPPNSSTLDNIRLLYGVQVARELIPVSCQNSASEFKMNGYVSNGNYSVKKPTFILFINNRLVESSCLKKVLDGIYSTYLPKGSYPFIYLSVEVEARNVDVNVHPTKHEVHFLHEDIITAEIGNCIDSALQGSNQSRTFYIQSLLPGAGVSLSNTKTPNATSRKRKDDTIFDSEDSFQKEKLNSSQLAPKYLVRTDPKEQTLDRYLTASTSSPTRTPEPEKTHISIPTPSSTCGSSNSFTRGRRTIKLDSVKYLCEKIQEDCNSEVLNIFRNHTFVGCVDRTHALIQHDTKLYMINTVMKSKELFYQKMIFNFGNVGCIQFDDPISVRELVLIALKSNGVTPVGELQETSIDVATFLQSKCSMLEDYFSLRIDASGNLRGIPLLLDNYIPSMELIPFYLLNLAKRVCWESELECFKSFCEETAHFYAVVPGNDSDNEEKMLTGQTWKWTIEHVLYPEFKKCILPSKVTASNSTIVELADLPNLYKVFERC